MVIAVIVVLLLIALIVMGFFLANYSMTGNRQTLEEARAWQEEHYDLSWYDPLEKTDYKVKIQRLCFVFGLLGERCTTEPQTIKV